VNHIDVDRIDVNDRVLAGSDVVPNKTSLCPSAHVHERVE